MIGGIQHHVLVQYTLLSEQRELWVTLCEKLIVEVVDLDSDEVEQAAQRRAAVIGRKLGLTVVVDDVKDLDISSLEGYESWCLPSAEKHLTEVGY